MRDAMMRTLLVAILLGIVLGATGCNADVELTLAEDRPNLLFFHAEF